MTQIITIDPRAPDAAALARAADILRRGGLVAFPTETVYGLGAHALDAAAVARVFVAKGRPAQDPLIVHIHDVAGLAGLVAGIPAAVEALASRFWPGPLTMVLRRSEAVPRTVTAGLDTVAIRVPAHAIAHALIRTAGIPVAAPSANLFSRPSPTCAEHVLQDLDGRIDMLIDGGPTTVGVESTVIDLTGSVPEILRPGAITLEMIRDVLPDARARSVSSSAAAGGMKSPGLLSKHYSPRAEMTLYEGPPAKAIERMLTDAAAAIAHGRRVGILAADEDGFAGSDTLRIVRLGHERDHATLAANLYRALRALDAEQVDLILARTFADESGLGAAIHDRLRRAAAGRIVVV